MSRTSCVKGYLYWSMMWEYVNALCVGVNACYVKCKRRTAREAHPSIGVGNIRMAFVRTPSIARRLPAYITSV